VHELLAERRLQEKRIQELESRLNSPKEPPKQESAPAQAEVADPEPKIDDVDDKGQPKYDSWEKFNAAQRKWDRDQVRKETIAEFENRMRVQEATKSINQKMEEGRARYKDLDSKVIPANQTIFQDAAINPAVKQVVNDSPYLVDLLYVLGSDPKAMEDFIQTARTNPLGAIRKAVLLESEIARELSKGKAEPEKKAPVKQISDAPPPPHQVEGTTTAGDEAEEAFKRDDFLAFRKAENRRELLSRKGK
jgi:hypothetical protein